MKNLAAILVFMLCAFAAQHTLNAQVETFLPNDAKSIRQLEGARPMNDFPFSKEDNKKVVDRDDPVFKLRATRSDDWDNGWTGYDSLINIYDNSGNITQSTSKHFDGAVWKNYEQYFRKYNVNNKETEIIFQAWDGVIWANRTRDNYVYDANNNRIQSLRYNWDGATWVNASRYDSEYDSNNRVVVV